MSSRLRTLQAGTGKTQRPEACCEKLLPLQNGWSEGSHRVMDSHEARQMGRSQGMKCHGLEQGKFWGTFGTVCSSCCSFAKLCSTLCHPMDPRLLCPSLSPWACSNSCPLSQWCHPPSHPLSSPSPPTLNLSQHQVLFQWVSSSD